jgi:propane monooxygenase large subunit
MSLASITKAHRRIQELPWERTSVPPARRYTTDYRLEKGAQKDPLKQILRSYFPMQQEKDDRVYGAIDGALRANMFASVEPRWMEWQKFFLSMIPVAEGAAARAMSMLAEVIPNAEIQNGVAIQMVDEMRHSAIQMNLKRVFLQNYVDPAGFDLSQSAFGRSYAGTIGRQFGEAFLTGDAITSACIYLQVVAETAFTNALFVAMPSEAAANGDHLLPTVFLSVQSDESRHINNGYATILMALADEENRPLIERDLRYAWWNNHCVIDAAVGTFVEYGTKDRRRERDSYAEMWRRWVYDDYYHGYLEPLERYGLKVPHDLVEAARERISSRGFVHKIAQFFATGWPLGFWRIDPLDERDFEWFEDKYPGWYAEYGAWWEQYRELSLPGDHRPIGYEARDYVYPLRCWSCMLPCVLHEDTVLDESGGEMRTYCSETCRWIDKVAFQASYEGRPTPAMGRLAGERDWELLYHGWDLAEVIESLGFVRDDGKTLVAQPHLHFDDSLMWTLDHVRGLPVMSPTAMLRAMTPDQRAESVAAYRRGEPVAG